MKKVFKVIGWIVLVLLVIIALALLCCFFYQKSAQKKDRELLERDGFVNLVSAGDFNMNVNIFGSGDTKIIALPGGADAFFPIDMKIFSEYLSDDVTLVVVSRPGYGLCEETEKDITTEFIVESTRTALKNAGIEAPYVLMPHSMGGIYGTYWESTYPDEISAVAFLDSVNEATEKITDAELEEYEIPPFTKFLFSAGVARTLTDIMHTGIVDEYGQYNDDADSIYGVNPTAVSPSCINEAKHFNSNMETAWASIETNDIPKIYVSTDYKSLDDANAQEWFDEDNEVLTEDNIRARTDYITKVGNCKEVNIPGSHFMYAESPEELAQAINDLLDRIAG